MRVIAIDPGYDRLGIAVLDKKNNKEVLVYSECFETSSKDDFNSRLYQLGQRVYSVIQEYKPNYMAIETLFFARNTKTALKVSESRGVVIFQASLFGIPICEYTPNQIKLAVAGYGSATKSELYTMTSRLIDLGDKKMIDDEVDAIAVALTFFAIHRAYA